MNPLHHNRIWFNKHGGIIEKNGSVKLVGKCASRRNYRMIQSYVFCRFSFQHHQKFSPHEKLGFSLATFYPVGNVPLSRKVKLSLLVNNEIKIAGKLLPNICVRLDDFEVIINKLAEQGVQVTRNCRDCYQNVWF